MHRFFVDPQAIKGGRVVFTPEQAHQLARVLRARAGDAVIVLDGTGLAYQVRLREIASARATGEVAATEAAGGEPGLRLALFQALLKGQKLDYVLQKGTELGVAAFVPVLCQRSVSRPVLSEDAPRLERWRAVIREAAEQSGRGRLPGICPPVTWEQACGQREGLALIAYEGETQRGLRTALAEAGTPEAVSLYVGPEGGLTNEEVEHARRCGIQTVSLGRRILRAETAGIAAAAAILYAFGELG